VYYAPASVIRRANDALRKDRYIFHKDNSDDWEPCPQCMVALGNCPELVRVENCLCWTPMADVLHMLPRVVHPVDVQKHDICEIVFPGNGKNRTSSVKEGFHLKLLDRKLCVMYQEEKSDGFINSRSAQWQVIDTLFQSMRDVMRSGTAFTSGKFWGVHIFQFVVLSTAR
jgi:hypothetical protein